MSQPTPELPSAARLNELAKRGPVACDCEACKAGLPHVPMFPELDTGRAVGKFRAPPQQEMSL